MQHEGRAERCQQHNERGVHMSAKQAGLLAAARDSDQFIADLKLPESAPAADS